MQGFSTSTPSRKVGILAQARAQERGLIKLRVIAKKYMESVTEGRQVRLVPAPWKGNTVIVNKKQFKGGETFEVNEKQAKALLETGCVQLASEKPKVFMPPSLQHNIKLSNGIVFRDDIQGKIPTRDSESNDYDSPWVNREQEDQYEN